VAQQIIELENRGLELAAYEGAIGDLGVQVQQHLQTIHALSLTTLAVPPARDALSREEMIRRVQWNQGQLKNLY
jgi:hypothetical protein